MKYGGHCPFTGIARDLARALAPLPMALASPRLTLHETWRPMRFTAQAA